MREAICLGFATVAGGLLLQIQEQLCIARFPACSSVRTPKSYFPSHPMSRAPSNLCAL